MFKASVHCLPFGETTEEGSWYPQVNGKNVGTEKRAFWPTKEEALAVAQDTAARMQKFASINEPWVFEKSKQSLTDVPYRWLWLGGDGSRLTPAIIQEDA